MSNIPCNECGALTDGYCPNCQIVTAHVHQFRATTSIVKELQSLALGLAQLCEQPTTRLADVQKGLKEYKTCKFCHQLGEFDFCDIECRKSYDDQMIEWGSEDVSFNF